MAVNYVCSACGRNWDADEYRDDLECPECSGRLVAQDKARRAGTPVQKTANPTIPNGPPAFKGLKVARPVGSLGARRTAPPAAPAPGPAEPDTGETQSVPTAALPSAELAAQMEALYAKRLEQAEEAAHLKIERAELEAERRRRDLIAQAEQEAKKRAEAHLAELQADLNIQIDAIRVSRQKEAEQAAGAFLAKAKEDAAVAAQQQIDELIGKAREDLAKATAENEAREKKLREAAEKLKAKSGELAEQETVLQERTRKAAEAEETLRTAVEKVKARKAELDKLDAEAKEAREKIEAEKKASEERLRTAIDKLKAEKAKIEEEKQAAEKQTTELREAAEKRAAELRAENEKRTQELAEKEKTLREVAEKLKTQRDQQVAAENEKPAAEAPAPESPLPVAVGDAELQGKLDEAIKAEQAAKRDLEKLQQNQDKRQKQDEDARKTAWAAANDAHHNQLMAMIAIGLLAVLGVLNAGVLLGKSKILGLVLLLLTAGTCWWTGMIYGRLRKAIEQLFNFFVKSSLTNRSGSNGDTPATRPAMPPPKKAGKAGMKRSGGRKSAGAGDDTPEEPATDAEKPAGEAPEPKAEEAKPETEANPEAATTAVAESPAEPQTAEPPKADETKTETPAAESGKSAEPPPAPPAAGPPEDAPKPPAAPQP